MSEQKFNNERTNSLLKQYRNGDSEVYPDIFEEVDLFLAAARWGNRFSKEHPVSDEVWRDICVRVQEAFKKSAKPNKGVSNFLNVTLRRKLIDYFRKAGKTVDPVSLETVNSDGDVFERELVTEPFARRDLLFEKRHAEATSDFSDIESAIERYAFDGLDGRVKEFKKNLKADGIPARTGDVYAGIHKIQERYFFIRSSKRLDSLNFQIVKERIRKWLAAIGKPDEVITDEHVNTVLKRCKFPFLVSDEFKDRYPEYRGFYCLYKNKNADYISDTVWDAEATYPSNWPELPGTEEPGWFTDAWDKKIEPLLAKEIGPGGQPQNIIKSHDYERWVWQLRMSEEDKGNPEDYWVFGVANLEEEALLREQAPHLIKYVEGAYRAGFGQQRMDIIEAQDEAYRQLWAEELNER